MPPDNKAISPDGLFDGYAPAERYVPTNEDKQLAKNLKDWFDRAYDFRMPWERAWELNRAYLKGDMLLARHKVTGDIVRLSSEDSRKLRSQNNILRPTSRSLVGKLAKMIPTYTVIPATSDFEETHGARCADLILQYVRSSQELDLTYTTLCSYLPWAGNSFAELCWDKLGGRKIAYCGRCNYFTYDYADHVGVPCPQCAAQQQEVQLMHQQHDVLMQQHDLDQQQAAKIGEEPPPPPPEPDTSKLSQPGEAVPPMVEAFEGDLKVIVRDPRDVFLPPGCTEVRFATRICIRETVEVAEVRRRFPRFALFIRAETDAFRNKQQYAFTDSTGSLEDLNDQCILYKFIERPTEAYPNGRRIFMVNDFIVDETDDSCVDLGRLPVFHFGFDPIEGELYRDPFINQAWHRQRELNLLETQMREHIEQVLRPKLMNPLGSRITNEEFHANSDQVINYAANMGEPKWINPPDLPQGIWQRKQDLLQDVRMQAGVTESEQGLTVSDPNGRAMAIINAEADQQVGPIVARNNTEWKALHRGIIYLFQKYAHPERKAAVAGPDGTQIIYFDTLNLLSPGWDVRMEQEEGASRNPAVRQKEALDLAQIGYFMNDQTQMLDKKAFALYAKLNAPGSGADQEATERAAASKIPQQILKGENWQPRSFDVPTIFADELANWLRGPGRRAPPEVSQHVEQIWMYYTQWAMTGQMQPAPGAQADPSMQGSTSASDTSAPGGSPNNPGHIGTDVAAGAEAQVQQADQTGENLASAY